jgi:hypothetical protein
LIGKSWDHYAFTKAFKLEAALALLFILALLLLLHDDTVFHFADPVDTCGRSPLRQGRFKLRSGVPKHKVLCPSMKKHQCQYL